MNTIWHSVKNTQEISQVVDPILFIFAILISMISAFIASIMYHYFYENRSTGSQVYRAFPLLSISVTTIFISIQISLPLSLGLLGALSFIRFRTPIKEPEEVGFIMLLIASSITCATFNFQFLLILYLFTLLALILIKGKRFFIHSKKDGILLISLSEDEFKKKLDLIMSVIKKYTRTHQLESMTSKEMITSLQISFLGFSKEISKFNDEIHKVCELKDINIYFNKPGGIH